MTKSEYMTRFLPIQPKPMFVANLDDILGFLIPSIFGEDKVNSGSWWMTDVKIDPRNLIDILSKLYTELVDEVDSMISKSILDKYESPKAFFSTFIHPVYESEYDFFADNHGGDLADKLVSLGD